MILNTYLFNLNSEIETIIVRKKKHMYIFLCVCARAQARERERELTWLHMKEGHHNVPMMQHQKTRVPVTI